MLELMARVYTFLKGEKGQSLVEYGLILALVAVAIVLGMMALADSLWVSDATCSGGNAVPGPSGKVGVFNKVICKLQG